MLIDTLVRRGVGASRDRESRERRLGEIPAKAFVMTLEGQNPGEHPAVHVLNTRGSPGTPGRAETQELRLVEPARASAKVYRQAKQ